MITPIVAAALLSVVSNVTDRVTVERTERISKGEAVRVYEEAVADVAKKRLKPDGEGAMREIEDLENRLPRLKGMAEIEKKASRESPKVRRDAAFCEVFAPVLLLSQEETRIWVNHLSQPGADLEKIDAQLYKKTSSLEFEDKLSVELSKYGCGYTQYVFTYSSKGGLAKLRKAIKEKLSSL